MSVKTFAAIDVGSFELTMKIFDFSGKNTMREIDCIRQRIDLGSDTYANGKISNEKMDDLCHTLKEFAHIMESYKDFWITSRLPPKGRRSAGSSRRRRRFWTLEAEVFRSLCLTRILWYRPRTYALVYYVYRSC